jgi:hypothetical protein
MIHLREALTTALGIIGLSACAAPGYAQPQRSPPLALPTETEASDKAWERGFATCNAMWTSGDDRAARDRFTECNHRLEASRPFCVSYKSWALVWFDLADDRAFLDSLARDPLGRTLSDVETGVINDLGHHDWDPPYEKLPGYKYQLRRILAGAIERPTKRKDSAEFADYVYQSCLHDSAARASP